MDASGKPSGRSSGNYEITLRVFEVPEEVYSVIYVLHETYWDREREVVDRTDGFAEAITSYGDFDVVARLRSKRGTTTIRRSLLEALREGHEGSPEPTVQEALRAIETN